MDSYQPIKSKVLTRRALIDLYADDVILANIEMTMFSADSTDQQTKDNKSGFELYSDRMARHSDHLEYRPNGTMKLFPKKNTPVVNFKQLRELLMSKDLNRNNEIDWIDSKVFRFLDGADIQGWHTCFTSFPRSGNTMLRR